MKRVIIIRYAEIHLKGNNRGFFEGLLVKNIKRVLKETSGILIRHNARYLVDEYNQNQEQEILEHLSKTFGIHSVSIAYEVDSIAKQITDCIITLVPSTGSFRVTVNRADKHFLPSSTEFAKQLGAEILRQNPNLTVNLHTPQIQLYVDIRENGKTFLYADIIKGAGGMPVGSSGKGLLLLSGGIDSPVSGYMMAKRGMSIGAVHFHSFPHTSLLAKEKVILLGKALKNYTCGLRLIMINIAEIQNEIYQNCPDGLQITILRRFMMRIAEKIAQQNEYNAILTGESLGQVASQTIEGIISTNAVTEIPILRPLIGFDKQEIIEIAQKIGTFETSILPHEDCCTVYLPKNPSTKPKLHVVEDMEKRLNIEKLINNSLESIEMYDL